MTDDLWRVTTEVESVNGVREVPLITSELMNRKIFIFGDITSDTADMFLLQMMCLQCQSNEPIDIYIDSNGGEVDAGLAIYDMITSSTVTIRTHCIGKAYSMGAVIFAAADKGNRDMLRHSKVMIHEPLIGNGISGSATTIKNISDTILEVKRTISEILAKHTGKDIEEVERAISFDNYMNAEESISFGICDSILEKIA